MRKPNGLGIAFISAMVWSLASFGAAADCSIVKGDFDSSLQSLVCDIETLPAFIIDETPRVYLQENNLWTLLLAGGGSIAMHSSGADDRIAKNFEDEKALSEFSDRGLDLIGGPGFHFAAAGVWYLLSANNCDELNKQRSWTMIKALSMTGMTTLTLKAIRNNDTPNGKPWAWPSGHTSSSFTVAAVLDEYYGPGVGVPAYALAGLVGYRMMETGDHWASDVMFGAVLGYITGHMIAGEDKEKWKIAGFDVVPYAGPASELSDSSGCGIRLVKSF